MLFFVFCFFLCGLLFFLRVFVLLDFFFLKCVCVCFCFVGCSFFYILFVIFNNYYYLLLFSICLSTTSHTLLDYCGFVSGDIKLSAVVG